MKRIVILIAGGLFAAAPLSAQIRLGDGQLTGSFETNSIYYIEDKGLGDKTPDDRFGSNNYLKADYTYGRFSAGLQADAYLPALQGYEIGEQADGLKFYLSSKYIRWNDRNFTVQVGDLFDQFGNGLIFRSFEDRQLGFNNSLEGIHGSFRFGQYVELKGMYGRPRLYTKYAGSWVRGLDARVLLSNISGWDKVLWTAEVSYVNRFERLDKDDMVDYTLYLDSPNLNMYSARMNFDWNGLYVRGEYVGKGKDFYSEDVSEADNGQAILGEVGYSYKGFSFSGAFRMLDRMGTKLSIYGAGTGNTLNYLPALTRQYTYMLASLEPYQVNTDGEIGGQIDLYYSYRSKSNRYKYWNFHANFSTYYTLHSNQTATGLQYGIKWHNMLWRDINVDVERQWNKKLKTTLLLSRQEYNPTHGSQQVAYVSNIIVADVTYKFNRKMSIRGEVQYLHPDKYKGKYDETMKNYEGEWVAALVEFNIAPQWSFFVSDMYNFNKKTNDGKSMNYYSGGFSYTRNRTRIQLSYGRNRAGYVCSGGVCRYSPAYSGINLALTTSF